MNILKTLTTVSILGVVSSDLVAAWDASVTFYRDAYFRGPTYKVYFSGGDIYKCLTFGCFNDAASSAHWDGMPASNGLGGPIHIEFFTDANCRGVQKRWKSTDMHPTNFALDGINDQISSFRVTEIFSNTNSYWQLSCSRSAMPESGLLIDSSVANATEATAQNATDNTTTHVVAN